MDIRLRKVVYILYQNGPLTLSELSRRLDFSGKTVKKLIDENRDLLEKQGARIQRDPLGPYSVAVLDQELFSKNFQDDKTSDYTTLRMQYLLKRLLETGGYLRIEDLAGEMYVSRATIDRLIPEFKEQLREYELSLESKAKKGIRIAGSEKNKRICYAHLGSVESLDMDANLGERVQDVLYEKIQEYDIELGDLNAYNLLQHCIIAIRRIQEGNVLLQDESSLPEDEYVNEKACAQAIADAFREEFGIEFPLVETQYIAIHLLGKQILNNRQAISLEVFAYVEEILEEIRIKKGIDLTGDNELKTLLIFHVQPLLLRIKYGLKQKNPLLEDIKKEIPIGYELSLCAAEVIYRHTGIRLNQDECSYLALHMAVALERREETGSGRKILVVCSSGRGTAQLLQHRLLSRTCFHEKDLVLISSKALDTYDFADVSCILTTVPLKNTYPVPTVLIDLMVNDDSQKKIQDFMNSGIKRKEGDVSFIDPALIFQKKAFSDRREALCFLAEELKRVRGMDLKDSILKREELSSTEVGNGMAIPHPYDYDGEELAVAFLTLARPILWKYARVSFVCLVVFPKEGSRQQKQISDWIAGFAADEGKVSAICKKMDYETLVRCFMEGEK